jgi:hypothetical protein
MVGAGQRQAAGELQKALAETLAGNQNQAEVLVSVREQP